MSEELPTRPRGNRNRFWVSVWGIKPHWQLWASTAVSSALQGLPPSQPLLHWRHWARPQIQDTPRVWSLRNNEQEDLTAQRYLHNGFRGKKRVLSSSSTLDKQAKSRSSMEYSMPKAVRCLSTLLLSLLLLLVELKLVAKVGNPIPLASTDKACWAVKMKLKENRVPPASWCVFLPSQRCNSVSGSPGAESCSGWACNKDRATPAMHDPPTSVFIVAYFASEQLISAFCKALRRLDLQRASCPRRVQEPPPPCTQWHF